jgi:predicted dehydrogenase
METSVPDTQRTYRVAIIGCGPRGTAGGTAYRAHPRTTVVGVCDLAAERATALGDTLSVPGRFSDHRVMIRETRPDVVVIATTADFHSTP